VTSVSDREHDANARRAETDAGARERELLDSLSSRVLNFLDDERRAVSRYLHDAPIQNLIGIRMNLERALAHVSPENSELRGLLAESIMLAEKSLTEMHSLTSCLHPSILDQVGVGAALRWYLQAVGRRGGLAVHLTMPDEMTRLPRDLETAIFRIAQEAVANARRHSGASEVFLRLIDMSTSVVLEVEDHGRGFEISTDGNSTSPYSPSGFGLLAIEERVKRLGGTFALFTELGKGTAIRVTLPVDSAAAQKTAAASAGGKQK
jgi:signal transduction histidine kinase